MPGHFRIEISAAEGQVDLNFGKSVRPIVSYPGLRLWCEDTPLQIGARGIVIGHLFEHGETSRRVSELDDAAVARILASNGRSLASDYWGGYVAVLALRDDEVSIFRDPSGMMPCYFRKAGSGITLSSDAADLGRAGGVDYPEVVRFLASAGAPSRKTCLQGLELLVPGECLTISAQSQHLTCWWSPWDWTGAPGKRRSAAAAQKLRSAALDCIECWASCFPSILIGVSGGLDSSIVASVAARQAGALHCLTMVEDDATGDERHYASILTEALGVPLLERHYDLESVDIGRAVAPYHPWPHAPFYMQAIAATHADLIRERPIDAIFSGNGGDNIFCSLRSASPFVDRFMAEGARPALFDTVRDISDLTGASGATVLRHAWTRYLDRDRPPLLYRDLTGLSRDAIAALDTSEPMHPWMDAPAHALPGKAGHVRLLARAQRSIELYPRRGHPQHVAPLLSQPIVETCLSIPTWQWIDGGRDRAIARAAFKTVVPDALLRRTSKGGPSGFMHRVYQAYAEPAHALLRDGLLARAGLLDLSFLEEASLHTAAGAEKAQRILTLCAAENWVRWWTDVGQAGS